MNLHCMTQFHARIADLELSVKTELSSVPGTYPDEVSLLGQISRKHFQCVPVFTFSEVEESENPKMRFIAILNINKFEVGKGYGANKRIAKMTAARMALQGMVPNVFQEWVTSCGRINALNRQNRNGVGILE